MTLFSLEAAPFFVPSGPCMPFDNAFCHNGTNFLETLDDPCALAQLGKCLFSAAVEIAHVNGVYKRPNVVVSSWQYDRELCTIRNTGVNETAADANKAGCVDKRVEGSNF